MEPKSKLLEISRYKPKHGTPKDGKMIEVTRNEVQVEVKRKSQLQHQSHHKQNGGRKENAKN